MEEINPDKDNNTEQHGRGSETQPAPASSGGSGLFSDHRVKGIAAVAGVSLIWAIGAQLSASSNNEARTALSKELEASESRVQTLREQVAGLEESQETLSAQRDELESQVAQWQEAETSLEELRGQLATLKEEEQAGSLCSRQRRGTGCPGGSGPQGIGSHPSRIGI